MRTTRACAALCALLVCAPSFAAPRPRHVACEPAASGAVTSFDVNVRGRERVQRTVNVPAGARLMIAAAEQNIDVFVAVPSIHAVSDNPVARWGPQRIVYDTGASTQLVLEVRGKEHERALGKVRVSITRLAVAPSSDNCVRAQELLASGDAHYAQTQLISLGEKTAPAEGAQREYEAAVRDYQAAASLVPASAGRLLRAQGALFSAAAVYQAMIVVAASNTPLSWSFAQSQGRVAEAAFDAVPDAYGAARARAVSAAAALEVALSLPADKSGENAATVLLTDARQKLERLATFHEQRGETFERALALNDVGIAFYYQGRFDAALRAYGQAVPLYDKLQERPRQAQALQNIGLTQYELGRFPDALASFARVLQLLDERDNPQLFADILNNRALVEFACGDFDSALKDYSRALATLTRIGASREQARSLHGIGSVYYALGDQDLAKEYFSRALALRSAALDPRGRIATLRAQANVMAGSGRVAEALALREQAFALTQGVPALRTRVLVQMATDSVALGKKGAAADLLERALAERIPSDEYGKAQALAERARIEMSTSPANAARSIGEALRIFRASEAPVDEFNTLLLGARVEQAMGHTVTARTMVDQAIGLAEQVRLQSANPELRAGLWHPVRPAFDFKIELLQAQADADGSSARDARGMALGTLVQETVAQKTLALKTLEVAEQSRGRALADYERLSGADAPSPERQAREAKREALYRELASRRFRLESYLDRALPDDPHAVAIRADIASMKRDIDLLNADLAGRARTPQALSSRPPVSGIEDVLQILTSDCAIVEYWIGEKSAYAWSATAGQLHRIDLGPSAPIEAAARALSDALSKFSSVSAEERLKRSQVLYRLIIAPLPEYARKARSLTFIPDGALHYVSFPTLVEQASGRNVVYLVDAHDVAIAPSLMALRENAATAPGFPMDLLLIADPVYSSSDPRLVPRLATSASRKPLSSLTTVRMGPPSRTLERLPGAAEEAEAIAPLFDSKRIDRITGFDASREALLGRDMTRYRYIHIAAHGIGDAGSPKFSQIYLSTFDRNGRPIVGDVYAGDLALRAIRADVVVLSACETALGRALSGEGLLGLRYAAHAGGARAVVASLWRAPDRAASNIMVTFYAEMVRNGLAPRIALARALRKARATFEDPALWGAFELSVAHPAQAP